MMRRFVLILVGFGIGFSIVALTVAAAVFFGLGVGGHILATKDHDVARIISYDPSTVAAKAPLPAAAAIVLFVVFVCFYVWLRRQDKQSGRSRTG